MFGSRSSKKTGLKIIIVGCGKVGVAILKQLANEGHDITIIDKDPQKVATYANQYDVMGIVGNGANHSVQLEAGIQNADLIAAVTSSDPVLYHSQAGRRLRDHSETQRPGLQQGGKLSQGEAWTYHDHKP